MYSPRFVLLVTIAAFSLSACGDSRYGIDGQITSTSALPHGIAILDSTASHKISGIHKLFTASADSLARSFRDSLATLDSALLGAQRPIAQAGRRLRSLTADYANSFKLMEAYRSFGGNSIFGPEDRKEPTDKLLDEIANRFYKGKTFSLEIGRQIRTTIRETLIPAEKRVNRARNTLGRLKNEHELRARARKEVEGQVSSFTSALVSRFNRRVIDRIEGGVLREAAIDSSGEFHFDHLPQARYHLYLRGSSPKLVEIQVDGHKRVRITGEDPSPLIHPSGRS